MELLHLSMTKGRDTIDGLTIDAPVEGRHAEILTARGARARRRPAPHVRRASARELLQPPRRAPARARRRRAARLPPETKDVREGDWRSRRRATGMQDRRVEITGPTNAKMVINALNSGAPGFMADFEDSNSPTWANMIGGQVNLVDAVRHRLEFDAPDGREYRLNDEVATLLVRPRGLHLPERHVLVDGEPIAGAFMDFALYAFHNAQELLDRGAGPFFYLPKLQSHLEARLWNEVFTLAEERDRRSRTARSARPC